MNQLTVKKDTSPEEFFHEAQLSLLHNKIKASCYDKITSNEIEAFIMHCAAIGLNPLKNQIHALPFYNSYQKNYRIVPQVSIDGLRAIAHRTGECGGIATKIFYNENGSISHCKGIVYRNGHKFISSVKFSEYYSVKYDKKGNPIKGLWDTKPETMIRKVAEAHALRMAFPENLSGLYVEGEHDQHVDQQVVEVSSKTLNEKSVQPVNKLEPSIWKRLNSEAVAVKVNAAAKGIDVCNGFAPDLYELIRVGLCQKTNSAELKNDINKLKKLVDDYAPLAIETPEQVPSDIPPSERSILYDDVAQYAIEQGGLSDEEFLRKYVDQLSEYGICKEDKNIIGMEQVLSEIMDDLKMWNAELTR